MNIVKLKDKIKPGDDFFNKYLKGKYAWWVHLRFIIPFDHLCVQGYVACEEDLRDLFKPPYQTEYRDTYDKDMWDYIDQEGTDAANAWSQFETKNKYTTSEDLTAEDVKGFREWVAKTLLSFDQNSKGWQMEELFTSSQTWVLQYYAYNMFDEVVRKLMEFASPVTTVDVQMKNCGCGNADLSGLYSTVSTCNSVEIYRKNMYSEMVKMFSEIEFWTRLDEDFLKEFKKYIDNILNMELPLSSSNVNGFSDCTCSSNNYTVGKDILKRLSEAFGYMISGEVSGHKNYIGDALYDWASQLYEKMMW